MRAAASDSGAAVGVRTSTLSASSYDTVRIPLTISETTLTGGFRLVREGEYFITMTSAEGLQNPSPIHYTMSVSSDAAPTIALLQPGGEAVIDETMILPTETQISDDFGFSWLRLHYRITESRYEEPWKDFRTLDIPIPSGDPAAIGIPWVWQMSRLGLTPGDAMEFYFEDRRTVPAPSPAQPGEHLVHLPASIAAKVLLLNEQIAQGVSNAELARRLGTRPQEMQRITTLYSQTLQSLQRA